MGDWKGVKPEAEALVKAVLFADTPPQESAAEALRRAYAAGVKRAWSVSNRCEGTDLLDMADAIERGEVEV